MPGFASKWERTKLAIAMAAPATPVENAPGTPGGGRDGGPRAASQRAARSDQAMRTKPPAHQDFVIRRADAPSAS